MMEEGFEIRETGDVLLNGSYCVDITRAICTSFFNLSKTSRKKIFPYIAQFLNFKLHPQEPYGEFLLDDRDTLLLRIESLLKEWGCEVVSVNRFDGSRSLKRSGPINNILHILFNIRKLFDTLINNKKMNAPNCLSIPRWDNLSLKEKVDYCKIRFPSHPAPIRYAGSLFVASRRDSYPPLPYDPTHAGRMMTRAVEASGAPQVIVDLCKIMECSGPRYHDFGRATARAWAQADFKNFIHGRNKGQGDALWKPIYLPSDVYARLLERISMPDPDDPSQSLLDRLRQLKARNAWNELDAYTLWPTRAGAPYSYSGFNYWFRRAMDESGLLLHAGETLAEPRRPTSSWFRHAVITADVIALVEEDPDPVAFEAGVRDICERMHQSSDQTRRYADIAYRQKSQRDALKRGQEREREGDLIRNGVTPLPSQRKMASSKAQASFSLIPTRRVP